MAAPLLCPELAGVREAGERMGARRPPALLNGEPLEGRVQWYMAPRRPYSRRELLADRAVNFSGALLAWVAAILLSCLSWASGDSTAKQLGFLAHGVGLITMLNCSAMYHYWCWDWHLAKRLYSLDHVGISAMIMGCYAPVMLHCQSYWTLAFVCVLGATGLSIELWKLSCATQNDTVCRTGQWMTLDYFNLVRYLLMGWAVLVVMPTLAHTLSVTALCGAVAGGLLYTGGVGFFVQEKLEFHMAIWHGCVLGASTCFYLVNLLELVGDPVKQGSI